MKVEIEMKFEKIRLG